jgi:hypothetical protein
MIERLQKILTSKFDYQLEEYALYEIAYKKSKLLLILSAIFVLIFIFFILDATGVINTFMNFGIFAFLFLILIIIPFALKKGSKYDAIIVTPEFLIQRTSKTEFAIVKFDNITKFKINSEGINIKSSRAVILLGLDMFREEIDPIIDILEAKGKTFDSEKEYMIRPIEIKIEDNKIVIIDIEDTSKSETELLYAQCSVDYEMLTPGFINEIIFRNSMVESSCVSDQNLTIRLNRFEVKGGHPENTTFGNIDVEDCIVVFEAVKMKKLILQDSHKKDEPDLELELDVNLIIEHLENAMISHWRSSGKDIDLFFATGVLILQASFSFKEVIIGWNKQK